jgi:hypothetical protein
MDLVPAGSQGSVVRTSSERRPASSDLEPSDLRPADLEGQSSSGCPFFNKRRLEDGFRALPMNSRESVRTSRRYQVRLPAPLASDLESFAEQHGLGLSTAVRLLVGRGLRVETEGRAAIDRPQDSPASLAALAAAEHSVLMVASVLPEGERRMRSLAERATEAAGERLALFQPSSDRTEENA